MTLLMGCVALTLLGSALAGRVNIVTVVASATERFGGTLLDELITAAGTVIVGLAADRLIVVHRERLAASLAQRLHILRATMRTVQDLFNNFLMNVQGFTIEA